MSLFAGRGNEETNTEEHAKTASHLCLVVAGLNGQIDLTKVAGSAVAHTVCTRTG